MDNKPYLLETKTNRNKYSNTSNRVISSEATVTNNELNCSNPMSNIINVIYNEPFETEYIISRIKLTEHDILKKLIIEVINNISLTRNNSYDEWSHLGVCLKKLGEFGKLVWIEYQRLCV